MTDATGRPTGRRGASRRTTRGGILVRWLPVVLVLALLGAAAAGYRFELGERWFGAEEPDPVREPAAVAPPEGLEVPALERPPAVAAAAPSRALSRPAVRGALARGLRDRDLGRSVHAAVAAARRWPAGLRVRLRGVHPGVLDQGGHRRRRAGRARAGPPVHDAGRRPPRRPDAGRRRRPESAGPSGAGRRVAAAGRRRRPRPADRTVVARAGLAPPGPAVLRRLAVRRPRRQPVLAGRLPRRRHRLADQRALGRRGDRPGRLRPVRRPGEGRGRRLRVRAARPGRPARGADPAGHRSPGCRRAGLGRERTAVGGRRAGARGQRQRGCGGAGPSRGDRARREAVVRRRGPRR